MVDDEYQRMLDEAFNEVVEEVEWEVQEDVESAVAAEVPRTIHHRRCFTLRRDASHWIGLSTLQKCTAAIRQLAYAGLTDMFDEYLNMGETTSLEVLRQFCRDIRAIFGSEYLRKPTVQDCQILLDMHGTVHNFPGMMGNIDCMQWEWRNCPVVWKWQFRSNNDINVLQSSPLINEQCRGEGPEIRFVANGKQYNMGYYLADGIYPRWPVFVKTI
ncbi:uncharacterized protein LOC121786621 [Salvia splendens]|uniref:uncharacterized protein LOC121786621 n=1 Tax=Salvia splendens TaxID=180675 RepID=UPI001C2674C0|nr:uncharacterized protein LOC121786621 [Salvia splendens]